MPYMLPQPQVRQTGWDQAGFATGVGLDILLKALLSGQVGGRPSAGVFQSPTGATTTISPAERVKGAPNVRLADLISKQGKGTFTPTQYSGLQVQPDLSRQLQQSQIQQNQAQTAALNQRANQPPIDLRSLIGSQGSQSGGSLFGNQASIYQVGDMIERDGKEYEVVGFDTDGTPLVELR